MLTKYSKRLPYLEGDVYVYLLQKVFDVTINKSKVLSFFYIKEKSYYS